MARRRSKKASFRKIEVPHRTGISKKAKRPSELLFTVDEPGKKRKTRAQIIIEGAGGEGVQGRTRSARKNIALAEASKALMRLPGPAPSKEVAPEGASDLWESLPGQHVPKGPASSVFVESLPTSGSSYNPEFEAHQDALGEAVAELIEEEDKEEGFKETARRALEVFQHSEGTDDRLDTVVAQMEGEEEFAPESDGEEAKEEPEDGENSRGTVSVPRTMQEVKKQKRLKERARIQKEIQDKKNIKRRNRVYLQMAGKDDGASSATAVKAQAGDLQKAKRQRKRFPGRKVRALTHEVQATEDLPGNLRAIQPVGNVFADHMRKMEEKGVIEPRREVPRKRYSKKKPRR